MGSDKKSEVRMDLDREEALQRLQSLVDDLKAGHATVGDRAIALSDRVRLKMEAESDELEIKLKWRKPSPAREATVTESDIV
jgi:amphi-Trp domain-containing protein